VLDRRARVDPPLQQPELEEQLVALVGRQRLIKRPPQVDHRALRRAVPLGRQAGLAQHGRDPSLAASRYRQQMGRHHLRRRPEIHQQLRRTLVLKLPLRCRELVVDGVAHERMHEAHRGLDPQDLRLRQYAAGIGDAALVELREPRGRGQPGAIAEHRQRTRDRHGVGGQPRQAQQHRARHGPRADLIDQAGVSGVGFDALCLQRLEQLAQ
jgi:hypothetical protein